MSNRTKSSIGTNMYNPDTIKLLETRKREPTRTRLRKQEPLKPFVKLSKCAKCSLAGIYIVAGIFILMTLCLFLFGFILKVNTDYDRFKTLTLIDPSVTPATDIQKMNFTYSTSPIDVIAIIVTFFGGSLLMISIGAIVGGCVKHKCLLGAIIAFICVILFLSFAGLFFTMSYVNDEVTRLLNSIAATAKSGYGTNAAVTESLNYVQYYFNCCGVQTNSDIYTGNYSSVCCGTALTQDTTWIGNVITIKLPTLNVTYNSCSTTTRSPCYTVMITWMKPLVITMIVVYFMIEIVLLMFVIFVFQALKAKNRVAPTKLTLASEKTNLVISRKVSMASSKSRKQSVYN